ncbi:MAG: oligosaccharide flippase family protein [Nitrososphaerota archaeon]|nr:oligosaccharide flippase family protein [Candidatus Calditenuaceae archaeon]MDW8073629.1 oligosaccharide flippase family protein [Nitrososphaerota archaeon]
MARGIRVRFSGGLLFLGNLATLVTGLIFNVLIARNLEPAVLGVWFFIGSVLPYFQVLEKAIPYWAAREIPRGGQVGRTTLAFNLLLSIPITIVFIALSSTLSSVINAQPRVFTLASLFIPVYYAAAALTAVTYSTEPHKLGLRTIIIDGVKIPLSLLLLPLGLEGVIMAVIAGNIAYVAYLYKASHRYLGEKFDGAWVKSQLRRVWLPINENLIGYLTMATDAFIVGLLLTSSDLSNYGIAMAIASVVGTAKGLTGAIYPKLLGAGAASESELRALFKFQHIFVTPMVAGGIVLAPRLVEIFGSRYLGGAPVLPLLLLAPTMGVLSHTMRSVVTGLEKADRESSSMGLVRTSLFTMQLPHYLQLATLVLVAFSTAREWGIMGAAVARLAASALNLGFTSILYARRASLSAVVHGLEKTVPSAAAMAIALAIINPRGSLFTLAAIGVGGLIYFAVLLILDRDSRVLAKRTVEEGKRLIVVQPD